MKILSELSPYEPAYMNIKNGIEGAGIFDESWFDEANREEDYHYYEEFLEQFANWMSEQDDVVADLNEYRNKPFDAEYYFQQYMEDPEADHSGIEGCYNAVYDWIEKEDEFVSSADYLDSIWRYDANATDIEFYANEYDIKENAQNIFHEQLYTSEDVTHGFKSAEDMVQAVMKAIDDGHLEDVDQYDAGGYGYLAAPDGTESYFETGSCWLGNSEEEWQLPTAVPYSEKNDYADNVDSRSVYRWFTISGNGQYLYSISTRMYIYGVPWQYVEEAGRELGLLGGDNAPAENTEENSDDIPRF